MQPQLRQLEQAHDETSALLEATAAHELLLAFLVEIRINSLRE